MRNAKVNSKNASKDGKNSFKEYLCFLKKAKRFKHSPKIISFSHQKKEGICRLNTSASSSTVMKAKDKFSFLQNAIYRGSLLKENVSKHLFLLSQVKEYILSKFLYQAVKSHSALLRVPKLFLRTLKEARNSFFGLGVYLLKSKFRIEDKLRFP